MTEKRIVGVYCRRGADRRIISAEPIIKEVECDRAREREHLRAFGAEIARLHLEKEAQKDDVRAMPDRA